MKNGFYKENEICLRIKLDLKSNIMSIRDPIIYRIKFNNHYKTKKEWCIYPMYNFAHCISDYIENITHSICTNEFINNNYLYDWILKNIDAKILLNNMNMLNLILIIIFFLKEKLKF